MAVTTGTAILAGTGLSVLSSLSEGAAASKEAKYRSALAGHESKVKERDFRKDISKALSASRAAGGASGVSQTTGSPLLAEADFMREAELQAHRIREGGEISADLLGRAGKAAKTRGLVRAGASLLSGIGRYNYYSEQPTTPSAPAVPDYGGNVWGR